ncbi:hypothetical protein AVEN_12446-1 [Araneus ventricosus]|uniref:Uncharacterized protein n=1 Tax=Araneus ventricosus TaxID=182803 RepID=A0A4Y2M859_ARAVE|nr:hypothetical protein AVEN_12446-1 [Araneus ventricosus]
MLKLPLSLLRSEIKFKKTILVKSVPSEVSSSLIAAPLIARSEIKFKKPSCQLHLFIASEGNQIQETILLVSVASERSVLSQPVAPLHCLRRRPDSADANSGKVSLIWQNRGCRSDQGSCAEGFVLDDKCDPRHSKVSQKNIFVSWMVDIDHPSYSPDLVSHETFTIFLH